MNTHKLDASGLKCPMPVIKLQQAMRQLNAGDQIDITCTDPSALKDIQSWCKINKHLLVSFREETDRVTILIQCQGAK